MTDYNESLRNTAPGVGLSEYGSAFEKPNR